MRLDYLIATATGVSRKDAKRAVAAGRVTIAGATCRNSAMKVERAAGVCLDGEPLTLPGERYLMMNKPAGVVSATRDGEHLTALSLLPADLRKDLHIAGRLDADTTGLLLLTTDGQWSHRVTSPRVECPKTYRVTLAEAITAEAIRHLQQGVMLRNDPKPTRPAQVHGIDPTTIELTLSEGRYHQVKRMLAAVGNHVVALHRLRIGDIELDPALAPGEFRALTPDEVNAIGR